jgi:hypothetical protein
MQSVLGISNIVRILCYFHHHYGTLRWSSGQHCCFLLGTFRVQIRDRKLTVVAEVCRAFLSTSRKIPEEYTLKMGHDRFLPHPFQFIVHKSWLHDLRS